jgi:hypothetical protein
MLLERTPDKSAEGGLLQLGETATMLPGTAALLGGQRPRDRQPRRPAADRPEEGRKDTPGALAVPQPNGSTSSTTPAGCTVGFAEPGKVQLGGDAAVAGRGRGPQRTSRRPRPQPVPGACRGHARGSATPCLHALLETGQRGSALRRTITHAANRHVRGCGRALKELRSCKVACTNSVFRTTATAGTRSPPTE